MSNPSIPFHGAAGAPGARPADPLEAAKAELTAGDEIVDVLASLGADEMAQFEVALCRWYRGELQAFESVRAIFDAHIDQRAADVVAKRDAQIAVDAAEAGWRRAA